MESEVTSLTNEGASSSQGGGESSGGGGGGEGGGGAGAEAEEDVRASPIRSPVPLISITAPDRGHRMAEDSEEEAEEEEEGKILWSRYNEQRDAFEWSVE